MKTAIIVSKKDPAGMNIKERLLEQYEFEKTNNQYENNEIYQLKQRNSTNLKIGGMSSAQKPHVNWCNSERQKPRNVIANENMPPVSDGWFLTKNNEIKLYTVEKESIYNDNLDNEIDAELFVFATKHESSSKVNSLCVHSPGNWGKAEFGGKDRKLCIAPACYLRTALFTLKKNAKDLDYEVIEEVTHHGPYLEKPVFFIEIGSNLESWKNKEAAEVIAKTIIEMLENKPKKYAIAFGIGGLHHTSILTRVMEKSDIAFGHICPKYNLHNLDKEQILQAIEKTEEDVDFVVLDWKGLGKEKQRILDLLKELNLEVKRSDKI